MLEIKFTQGLAHIGDNPNTRADSCWRSNLPGLAHIGDNPNTKADSCWR